MAVNVWWSGDSRERYWLEITDREELGADLHAPQVDGAGRPNWTYDLLRHVEPGDVVLHWHRDRVGRPAIVGFSHVIGPAAPSTIIWQARGSYGRARGPATVPVPSWSVPLNGYKQLAAPVDQDVLRRAEPDLRAAMSGLAATHPGSLYFPFAFSDKRPVRTAQGYLVKFPAELLSSIPGLDEVPRGARRPPRRPGQDERPSKTAGTAIKRSGRSSGYVADAVLRRALEMHAVAQATAYYQRDGWEVADVGAKESYDLLLTDPAGGPERHVEVKGSSQTIDRLELTANEVRHSRAVAFCDLFVVDDIHYLPDGLGGFTATGGYQRIWENWQAIDADLEATRFRYRLPPPGAVTVG